MHSNEFSDRDPVRRVRPMVDMTEPVPVRKRDVWFERACYGLVIVWCVVISVSIIVALAKGAGL